MEGDSVNQSLPFPPSAMAAHHSSESPNWYTPLDVVEDVRWVLGGRIGLDPSSCARAQERVRAEHWLGIEQNGLTYDWQSCGKDMDALVNVPSARGLPPAVDWFVKLGVEVARKTIRSFVWVAFNANSLESIIGETERLRLLSPRDCHLCLPRDRIAFERESETQFGFDGRPVLERPKNPPNWTVFLCFGPKGVRQRFARRFGERGTIWTAAKKNAVK